MLWGNESAYLCSNYDQIPVSKSSCTALGLWPHWNNRASNRIIQRLITAMIYEWMTARRDSITWSHDKSSQFISTHNATIWITYVILCIMLRVMCWIECCTTLISFQLKIFDGYFISTGPIKTKILEQIRGVHPQRDIACTGYYIICTYMVCYWIYR